MSEQQRKQATKTSRRHAAAGKPGDGCWVDFYDGPVFGGRLRRLRGPADFCGAKRPAISGGSLIVGPEAVLVVLKNPKAISLHPKQIVPDLAKTRLAGALEDFKILTADSMAGS